MSKSSNMLRTRRKDNNVKPNRRDYRLTRLDRKSSRGMIYENEELRLKTININAEIERGQSDIKKLKRENELLKKEIWCLRDEYDKLDKLLKDKKIDFSSSSTTCSSSDSESCSSCTEDSEEVETSQNLENVQKTNLKNIRTEFDHLSVVPEENSTENSDKNSSTRASLPNDHWNYEKGIIKPDQSYPTYANIHKAHTLPMQDKMPVNFFSPIKISKSFDENCFNQNQANDTLYPGQFYSNSIGNHLDSYHNTSCPNYTSEKIVNTNATNFYQNMILVPKNLKPQPEATALDKASTDLIVKMDNQNFSNQQVGFEENTPTRSTFSNGGNLEDLLNDIETISQRNYQPFPGTDEDFMSQIQREDLTYLQNPVMENLMGEPHQNSGQKPYKSELNVVLMPNPMPLIGFDKYKNINRSFDSINSKQLEDMSASQQDLCVLPPQNQTQDALSQPAFGEPPPPLVEIPKPHENERNPFFFGNLKDNYINSDYFNMRYNPDSFIKTPEDPKRDAKPEPSSSSKTNLLDLPIPDLASSENEENLKFKTSKPEKKGPEKSPNSVATKLESPKTPKLSIRRKVSIHFKGKKDKLKKFNLDSPEINKTKTPTEKITSLFDIKFGGDINKDKNKSFHQKTPSVESKKSTTETSNIEPKTPTSSDSKTSNSERKLSTVDGKLVERKDQEKKLRKSSSVSPERSKHVHVKDEGGGGKKHKKHKKSERARPRRSSTSADLRAGRERSFSVCTDRSNMLEHRLGLGFTSGFLYDDYSDRERTNSVSSCETLNTNRKMSTLSNVPISGSIPWCGCWGNGCL